MSARDLRQVRALLGLTQAALADALGMHPNTIARMERGELAISPRTEKALRLLMRG